MERLIASLVLSWGENAQANTINKRGMISLCVLTNQNICQRPTRMSLCYLVCLVASNKKFLCSSISPRKIENILIKQIESFDDDDGDDGFSYVEKKVPREK